jgi:hypothetical protein
MTADVFLLTFFFPSGFKVERHVLQGASLFGAVRQDTLGKLPDVPVPKKINSMPGAGRTESGESPDSDIIELRELVLGVEKRVGVGFAVSLERIRRPLKYQNY